MALFFPVTTYSVGESELIIHFQEAYAWLFSVPLATSSVGESGLIIHFQERLALSCSSSYLHCWGV